MSRKCFNMTSHKKGGHFKPDVLQMRDEDMTARKVRVILQVHVPQKPERYGIKAYLVSKYKSGYIYYNMDVSTGQS